MMSYKQRESVSIPRTSDARDQLADRMVTELLKETRSTQPLPSGIPLVDQQQDTKLLRAQLLSDMSKRKDFAYRLARRLEALIMLCWWGSLLLVGLASLSGLAAAVPSIDAHIHIQPWMISVMVAVGTGLEVIRRRAMWRRTADACYALHDDLRTLIRRLIFEVSNEPKHAEIVAISRAFEEADRRFSRTTTSINKLKDAVGHSRAMK